MPFISVWFLMITSWLVPLLSVIALVLGIIAYVKKQPKALHAIIAAVLSFGLFVVVNRSDIVERKAEDAAAGAVGVAVREANRLQDLGSDEYEISF